MTSQAQELKQLMEDSNISEGKNKVQITVSQHCIAMANAVNYHGKDLPL